MPCRPKFLAQFEVIVDLAVVDDPITAVGVGHRLQSRVREIDDAETAVTERHRPDRAFEHPPAAAVRPAMRDCIDMGGIGREAEGEPDAAHASYAACDRGRPSTAP